MSGIPGYDDWKLEAPDDQRQAIGEEEGDPCGRIEEPEEDAPRGHRPKPCAGIMIFGPVENCSCHISPPCGWCENNPLVCDTCGAEVEA